MSALGWAPLCPTWSLWSAMKMLVFSILLLLTHSLDQNQFNDLISVDFDSPFSFSTSLNNMLKKKIKCKQSTRGDKWSQGPHEVNILISWIFAMGKLLLHSPMRA